MAKISMHQKNKLISGGKRLAWLIPAVKAAWSIFTAAFGIYHAAVIVEELVEVATPDEDDEKGLVILKPWLLLCTLFTLQVLPLA